MPDTVILSVDSDGGLMMRRTLVSLVIAAATLSAEAAVVPDELLNSMSFRLVGPFRGGRVTAVTGVRAIHMTYYMGSTGGGVWKTTDAGINWRNVSDVVRRARSGSRNRGSWARSIPSSPRPGSSVHRSRACPRCRRRTARRGSPSARRPSAPSRSRRRIPTSSGSAPVRPAPAATSHPATGSTSRTDAGETWRHMGLDEAGQIGRDHRPPDRPGHRLRRGARQHLRRQRRSGASTARPTAG